MQTASAAPTLEHAAIATPPPLPRDAMFVNIHKGLRNCMVDALLTVGRADDRSPDSVTSATVTVRALLDFCRVHLHSENQFVHPAMEARRPGSSAGTAQEHVEHEQAFDALLADLKAVERSTGTERAGALGVLYQRLTIFIADNFEHMAEEEAHNQQVLWDVYTDDELHAIEGAIVASHTPEQNAMALRWMLPALSPSERVRMLTGIKQGMPAEAFQGLLAFAASVLPQQDGLALRAALLSERPDA